MKEGWKMVKLGECFSSINNGANIKQIKGAQGFPITRIETLSNDKFNRDRMGYANIYDISKYSNYILNNGDILMSHINSMKFLGRSVLYNKINDETIIHGMNLLRLVPITNLILCSYVNYYFSTKSFKEQIQGISHQSVNQASFNVTSLKNLEIPLPPFEEQHRIVGILDAAFAKIDALKANAEANLTNAKALFQQLLAQELQPKEGWVEKKLEEVIKLQSGENLPAKHMREGKYPVYGGNGVSGYHDEYNMIGDNVIIGRVGALCGNVRFLSDPFWLTDNGFKVILKSEFKIDLKYLTNYLNFANLRQYAKQTAQPVISNVALKEVIINIPPLEEQHRIVSTLDTLSEKCRRLEQVAQQTIRECDALKQSILCQVFSGEL